MKRILLALTGTFVAASVMGAGMTGAYLTGQSQVADNIVKAGTVAVSTEPTTAALSVDALAPGSEATRTLSVVNDGNLPVSVVCSASKKAGITALWEALSVRATDGSGAVLYNGPMTGLATAPLRLEKGARSQLAFAIGLPATAGNDLAGDYAKFSVVVDAEQVR
jgi:hypothetical protein